ncbi:MAG: hemin transporter [Planctomycetes bacterium]|nr:hemin transporter [Planctomycetota bacterium]
MHHAAAVTDELPIYDLLGADKIEAMVAAFYRRVPGDDLLGPMYPADDWAGAEHRLKTFLVYRFGGPHTYLEERGHPRLRMRHMPFSVDRAARDRWLALMMAAVDEVGVSLEHRSYLERFFTGIATFLRNR